MSGRKEHTRRAIIQGGVVIPAALATSAFFPEDMLYTEVDLSTHSAYTIAHNASSDPRTLERALESSVDLVEADITLDGRGQTLIGHETSTVDALSATKKELQKPNRIIPRILHSGKGVLLDFKDEIKNIDQAEEVVSATRRNTKIIASSNNHQLLQQLDDTGEYFGDLFYSIGSNATLLRFLAEYRGHKFGPREGVSIRHDLLTRDVPLQLLDMKLQLAAWSPKSSRNIAQAIKVGANYVTSDSFELLGQVGKPDSSLSISGPQLPVQG